MTDTDEMYTNAAMAYSVAWYMLPIDLANVMLTNVAVAKKKVVPHQGGSRCKKSQPYVFHRNAQAD